MVVKKEKKTEKRKKKKEKITAKGPILLAAAAAGSGSITSPVSDMQARAVEPMQNLGGGEVFRDLSLSGCSSLITVNRKILGS